MALINRRITQLLYVGLSNLSLATLPASAKSAIKLIRQVNTGGTGYASFDPSVTVNSLTVAVAPTPLKISQYIVEMMPGYDPFELPDFEPVLVGVASSELNLTLEAGVQSAPLTVNTTEKVGSWKVASVTGITTPTYLKNGSAPASLTVNQVLTLALGDVLEVEGEVANVGAVRLIPN